MSDSIFISESALAVLEFNKIKTSICRYSTFELGTQLIMSMQPQCDHLWINNSLSLCEQAMKSLAEKETISFQTLSDTRELLNACTKDQIISAAGCFQILKNIDFYQHLKKYFINNREVCPQVCELADSIIEQEQLAEHINLCLDGYGNIKCNASIVFNDLSNKINKIESELSLSYQRFVRKHASALMESQISWRNNRRCVLVKETYKNQISGILHGESTSGQSFYIEPAAMNEMNNEVVRLNYQLEDEKQRILFELAQLIKKDEYACMANLHTYALLDSIYAKAQWAIAHKGCIAKMGGAILSLKEACHPLIDAKSAVYNNYRLTATQRSMLISGSNTGGKTVTLKTIGLSVCMSMAGFPCIALSAKIPWYEHMFIDIGDHQSIQESLSTFSSHMSKLAKICDCAQMTDIVLIDELGSGSDPSEGEALAYGIFQLLTKKQITAIVTTHFNALKQIAAIDPKIISASVEFNTVSMQPTFRFLQGNSGSSYAFEIAKRCGINVEIIATATRFKQQQQDILQQEIEDIEKNKILIVQQKQKLDDKLSEISGYHQNLAEQNQQLQKRKKQILAQYEAEATEWLEEKRQEMTEKIDAIGSSLTNPAEHIIAKSKHDLSSIEIQLAHTDIEQIPNTFKVGDYVEILPYHYYGDIVLINKNQVVVYANNMKMNVNVSNLREAKRVITKKNNPHSVSTFKPKRSELNIIGLRVEEALALVDDFLDQALLQNLSEVKIIHGIGTLALRNGVRSFLLKQKFVKGVENGSQGDGGLGVSVVILRSKE